MSMFDLVSSGSRSMGGAYLGGAMMGGAVLSKEEKEENKRQRQLASLSARMMVVKGDAPNLKSAKKMLKDALEAQQPPKNKRVKRVKSDMKVLKQHLFGKPARTAPSGKQFKATPNFIRQLTEEEAKELLVHINEKYGAGFWDSVANFGNAVLEGAPKVLKTVASVAPYVAMLL
jgi:hypothetical protein